VDVRVVLCMVRRDEVIVQLLANSDRRLAAHFLRVLMTLHERWIIDKEFHNEGATRGRELYMSIEAKQ